MHKITMVAADIDGTLCMKGENIMPLTRKALNRLHEEGVLFGPASGRPIDHRVLDKAKEWGLDFEFDFAIGMNGGELYDAKTKEMAKFHLLPKAKIREILTFLKPFNINAIVYVNGYEEVRALRMDTFMKESIVLNGSHVIIGDIDTLAEFDTGKIEVQFPDSEREGILKAVKEHQDPSYTMVQTFRNEDHCTFEFLDPRINKGLALTNYAKKYDIPINEVLAFGDQENDIGLLRDAGFGVCLKNGADASKAVSNAITEYDVFNDGVGHWLFDHYFDTQEK